MSLDQCKQAIVFLITTTLVTYLPDQCEPATVLLIIVTMSQRSKMPPNQCEPPNSVCRCHISVRITRPVQPAKVLLYQGDFKKGATHSKHCKRAQQPVPHHLQVPFVLRGAGFPLAVCIRASQLACVKQLLDPSLFTSLLRSSARTLYTTTS